MRRFTSKGISGADGGESTCPSIFSGSSTSHAGGSYCFRSSRCFASAPVFSEPSRAATTSPVFTENPGDAFKAWDCTVTFDYMPDTWTTFRIEYNHRESNVPYFAGSGGVTPPGGNTGMPGSSVTGWAPDLRTTESRLNLALLVKF